MLSQNPNKPVIDSVGDTENLRNLILSAKRGNSEAFGAVYSTLYTPLYRYTFSRCRDVELANDICQQAFLRFFQALPGYEPDKSPLAYLFTIAKHLLINESVRKAPSSFDESLFETMADESTNVVQDSHVRLLSEKIDSFLPSLTKDEEEVVRMHYYGELSHKEIGEVLRKEEATIRKIKERALKKLRALTRHLYD
ncbi:MAG: RNA polymerase sigma factor [Candidatus Paceibacterota bacterium]